MIVVDIDKLVCSAEFKIKDDMVLEVGFSLEIDDLADMPSRELCPACSRKFESIDFDDFFGRMWQNLEVNWIRVGGYDISRERKGWNSWEKTALKLFKKKYPIEKTLHEECSVKLEAELFQNPSLKSVIKDGF